MIASLRQRLEAESDSEPFPWIKGRVGYRFGHFVIGIYSQEKDRLGLGSENLEDLTSNRLLQFTTFSPFSIKGRVAAGIATDGNGVFLVHSGKVFPRDGRGRPFSLKEWTISGKPYFGVCDLSSSDCISRIIDFHVSRSPVSLSSFIEAGVVPVNSKAGIDPGAQKGGWRSGGQFDARHAPIVNALRQQLENAGFKVIRSKVVRPDIFVEKMGKKVIFEIKPDALATSIFQAIGQVICYSAANAPCERYVVCPKIDASVPTGSLIYDVMGENGIKKIDFDLTGTSILFSGLPT